MGKTLSNTPDNLYTGMEAAVDKAIDGLKNEEAGVKSEVVADRLQGLEKQGNPLSEEIQKLLDTNEDKKLTLAYSKLLNQVQKTSLDPDKMDNDFWNLLEPLIYAFSAKSEITEYGPTPEDIRDAILGLPKIQHAFSSYILHPVLNQYFGNPRYKDLAAKKIAGNLTPAEYREYMQMSEINILTDETRSDGAKKGSATVYDRISALKTRQYKKGKRKKNKSESIVSSLDPQHQNMIVQSLSYRVSDGNNFGPQYFDFRKTQFDNLMTVVGLDATYVSRGNTDTNTYRQSIDDMKTILSGKSLPAKEKTPSVKKVEIKKPKDEEKEKTTETLKNPTSKEILAEIQKMEEGGSININMDKENYAKIYPYMKGKNPDLPAPESVTGDDIKLVITKTGEKDVTVENINYKDIEAELDTAKKKTPPENPPVKKIEIKKPKDEEKEKTTEILKNPTSKEILAEIQKMEKGGSINIDMDKESYAKIYPYMKGKNPDLPTPESITGDDIKLVITKTGEKDFMLENINYKEVSTEKNEKEIGDKNDSEIPGDETPPNSVVGTNEDVEELEKEKPLFVGNINYSYLRFRTGPSTKYTVHQTDVEGKPVNDKFLPSDMLNIYEEKEGGEYEGPKKGDKTKYTTRYKIIHNGKVGWVGAEYVKKNETSDIDDNGASGGGGVESSPPNEDVRPIDMDRTSIMSVDEIKKTFGVVDVSTVDERNAMLNAGGKKIIVFGASRCGPCKELFKNQRVSLASIRKKGIPVYYVEYDSGTPRNPNNLNIDIGNIDVNNGYPQVLELNSTDISNTIYHGNTLGEANKKIQSGEDTDVAPVITPEDPLVAPEANETFDFNPEFTSLDVDTIPAVGNPVENARNALGDMYISGDVKRYLKETVKKELTEGKIDVALFVSLPLQFTKTQVEGYKKTAGLLNKGGPLHDLIKACQQKYTTDGTKIKVYFATGDVNKLRLAAYTNNGNKVDKNIDFSNKTGGQMLQIAKDLVPTL